MRNIILRPDIHSKAFQLGLLDLAGSKIEDRQYQLIIRGVSLNTTDWLTISSFMSGKSSSDEYTDNPAFEWNTLEDGPVSHRKFSLNTIFKDSTFSFIYAPSIQFQQTLVAGIAMEFNCINEMDIELTLNEILLLLKLSDKIKNLIETRFSQPSASIKVPQKTQHIDHKISTDKKSIDDSGVGSLTQSRDKKTWKKKSSVMNEDIHVPSEFTFTSSKFKINCTVDGRTKICAVLDTPNILMTVDKYEKILNISLHDLLLMHDRTVVFSTRDGIVGDSGIKPSLLRINITEKSVNSMDVDVCVKRPIQLSLSHHHIEEISQIVKILQENSIISSNAKIEMKIPKNKAKKLDLIKGSLNNMRNFNLTTDQIVVNMKSDEYEFKFASTNMRTKIKVFDRPEKIEGTFEVLNLIAVSRGKIFLHPLSIQIKSKIVQEYWKKDPMLHVNVNADSFKFDIKTSLINDLKSLASSFGKSASTEQKKLQAVTEKTTNLIQMFPSSFETDREDVIEHFQDDLRSGAFQFIEISTTRDLPFPYQIQIIDSVIGIVCWRYPLPRALHKIKIFPVPFQTVKEVVVSCKLEYYSQPRSKFIELCEFSLTENESRVLDLKENKPFAEIWRIQFPRVVLRRDSDDEDDGFDSMDEFLMHPKVLVACLRIDSFYVPSSIPKVNFLVEIGNMELTLFNQMNNGVCRNELSKYKLNDIRSRDQEAAKLILKSVSLLGQYFDENLENFEVEARVRGEVVENCYQNYVSVFDECDIKALLKINYDDLDLSMSTGHFNFNYSPDIGQSLLITKKIWEKNLKAESSDNLILNTKFIICNNTTSLINLNQHGANECICIMPQSFILYHFRTDKLEDKIELSIRTKGSWTLKSEPFSMHQETVQRLKVGENIFVIVRVKNHSNYQKKVIIDGAVSVYNMTKEVFHVQYRRYDKEIETLDKCEISDLNIANYQNSSLIGPVCSDSQQAIKLRMTKNERKIFSGEIPLREIVANNKPWLVKIPASSNSYGYVSFWVRIIRETDKEITRVLVMIWPMFVAKSNFPMDITVRMNDDAENFNLHGRGVTQELDMGGTHEDEHQLLLDDRFVIDGSNAKVNLSYKLVNRNTFFKIPEEFAEIEKAIQMLQSEKKDDKLNVDDIVSIFVFIHLFIQTFDTFLLDLITLFNSSIIFESESTFCSI